MGIDLDRLQAVTGGTAAASPWQWGRAFGILGLGVLFGPVSLQALRRAMAGAGFSSRPSPQTESTT